MRNNLKCFFKYF